VFYLLLYVLVTSCSPQTVAVVFTSGNTCPVYRHVFQLIWRICESYSLLEF